MGHIEHLTVHLFGRASLETKAGRAVIETGNDLRLWYREVRCPNPSYH